MPNTLVLGFTVSDLIHSQNFLWATLVGPYWFIEKCVFYLLTAVILFAATYDLISLMALPQRDRHEDDCLCGYTNVNPSPRQSQSNPLKAQSQGLEKENIVHLPERSKVRELEKPVPQIEKLTAADLKKKALGDFIGGDR